MEGEQPMNWANRNVFITGGDGFIGSWLAKKLVEKVQEDLKKKGIGKNMPGYCIRRHSKTIRTTSQQ